MKLRVYADSGGRILMGLALSAGSLATLVSKGYLEADRVEIKGSIDGRPVHATIDEADADEFLSAIAV